jgi:PAS domain S-box-containing protein
VAVKGKDRLEAILRTISDGVLTLDHQGVITYANPAAQSLLGRKESSVVGEPIRSFVVPETLDSLKEKLGESSASSGASFEILVARAEGGAAPLDVKSDPIKPGEAEGAVWVLRDASERTRLEQKRGEFFAALTHDVKNALGIIMSSAEILLLKARETKATPDEKILDRMMNNTFTVQTLVSNYLDLSIIEGGQLHLTKKSLDLNAVLRWVARQHEVVAERRGIALELKLAPALPSFEADPLCLERIFANLLHNALKFTPDNAPVTVRSGKLGGELVVEVQDTGPGIEADDLARIFEKYGRGADAGNKEGQGLGLFIVKELVEAHAGRIEIKSTPGQGSCFSVFFPAGPGAAGPQSRP